MVIGELTHSAVRAHILQFETDIYEFYNANNGDKDFDIICADVVRTGTRLPQRVCEPLFLTKERQPLIVAGKKSGSPNKRCCIW